MTATLTAPPRAKPQQARAERTLQNIVDAARAELAEHGRDRLTTALVAARARVSIGTFYRYFDDRVALLDYLHPDRTEGLERQPILREVTTREELDAVPLGSLVMDGNREVYRRNPQTGGPHAYTFDILANQAGGVETYTADDILWGGPGREARAWILWENTPTGEARA